MVKWSIDEKLGTPIVLAAGKLGQVWVLDSHKQASLWVGAILPAALPTAV